jgi:phosphohistidine phosphatase SixA
MKTLHKQAVVVFLSLMRSDVVRALDTAQIVGQHCGPSLQPACEPDQQPKKESQPKTKKKKFFLYGCGQFFIF